MLRLRARLGRVDEHREAGISDEVHRLEPQADLSDERVAHVLHPTVVRADVVRRPEGSEELAAGRELADEFRELTILLFATGFGAEDRDDIGGDLVPVDVETL